MSGPDIREDLQAFLYFVSVKCDCNIALLQKK
jgi:hypothetical protein